MPPAGVAAAGDDDSQPVELVDRAGGGERRELAERVAGVEIASRPAAALEAGKRGAIDRRLGEARAVADAGERILPGELGGEREQVGAILGDEIAMSGVADSLAGKEDGELVGGGHATHLPRLAHAVNPSPPATPQPGGGRSKARGGRRDAGRLPGQRTRGND
jgi:hypothetical protein